MNLERHKGTGIRAVKGQFVSPTLALKVRSSPTLPTQKRGKASPRGGCRSRSPELKMEVTLRCSEMSAHQSIHLRTISTIVPSLLHTLVRGHTFACFKDLNISTLTFP